MGKKWVAEYRTIDGVLHKLCRGPLHPNGRFIPVSDYFVRPERKGRWRSRCIDCEFARKGYERNIFVTQMWVNWLDEIVSRVGVREGCRRMGLSPAWYRWFKRTKPKTMRKRTARKIVNTLRELRSQDIVRHRDSIHHGSAQRGHREKVPNHPRDYYHRQWE